MRCEDFAEMGKARAESYIRDLYGDRADEVVIDRVYVDVVRSDDLAGQAAEALDVVAPKNHIANRVILPDGRRYLLDYWDHARGGSMRMVIKGSGNQEAEHPYQVLREIRLVP